MTREFKRVVPRKEFALAGYDSLQWFEGEVPLESSPQVGQRYRARPDGPFPSLSPGEEFWSVFRPPFTHFNGWEERLEEIRDSSFVLSEVTVSGEGDLEVSVVRILPLDGSVAFEAVPKDVDLNAVSLLDLGRSSVHRWSCYTLVDRNLESDVGEWFLLKEWDGKSHLILFGEWDFQRDWVYMGNSETVLPDFVLSAGGQA